MNSLFLCCYFFLLIRHSFAVTLRSNKESARQGAHQPNSVSPQWWQIVDLSTRLPIKSRPGNGQRTLPVKQRRMAPRWRLSPRSHGLALTSVGRFSLLSVSFGCATVLTMVSFCYRNQIRRGSRRHHTSSQVTRNSISVKNLRDLSSLRSPPSNWQLPWGQRSWRPTVCSTNNFHQWETFTVLSWNYESVQQLKRKTNLVLSPNSKKVVGSIAVWSKPILPVSSLKTCMRGDWQL